MVKKWHVLNSRIDKDYRVFRVRAEQALSPRTQASNEFYALECGNWVNIVPLTPDRDVVMIRQYRHGSREVTLEIPGGAVDETDPAEAAKRELAEETGYESASITLLGAVNPNPAIFNNLCYTYFAEDVAGNTSVIARSHGRHRGRAGAAGPYSVPHRFRNDKSRSRYRRLPSLPAEIRHGSPGITVIE